MEVTIHFFFLCCFGNTVVCGYLLFCSSLLLFFVAFFLGGGGRVQRVTKRAEMDKGISDTMNPWYALVM